MPTLACFLQVLTPCSGRGSKLQKSQFCQNAAHGCFALWGIYSRGYWRVCCTPPAPLSRVSGKMDTLGWKSEIAIKHSKCLFRYCIPTFYSLIPPSPWLLYPHRANSACSIHKSRFWADQCLHSVPAPTGLIPAVCWVSGMSIICV